MAEATAAAASLAASPGIAGTAVALLVVDDDRRVAEASLTACRLLGLGRDEVLERPLDELLAPAAADRLHGIWSAFHATGGHAGPFELAWPNRAGPVDISVTAAVLPGRHLVLLTATGAGPAPPAEARGEPGVRRPTPRERQILGLLATGDTDVEVAAKLGLSPATVQTHVRNAKAKLGARTRAQAVAVALRGGLIDH